MSVSDADNVLLSGFTVDGATGDGIVANYSAASVTPFSLDIRDVTSTNNGGDGLGIRTTVVGSVNALIRDSIFNGNGAFGVLTFFRGSGAADVNIVDNIMSMNTRDGLRISARDTFTADFLVSGNQANTNTESGFNLRAEGAGTGTYTVLNNTATGNTGDGFLFRQTSGVLQLKVQSNVSTGNGSNGMQFSDSSAGTQMILDIGGGSLGSLGQNSVFANTSQDVRIDIDGDELKAENNWWGVSTGLAGGELQLDSGTVDADPFLISAP